MDEGRVGRRPVVLAVDNARNRALSDAIDKAMGSTYYTNYWLYCTAIGPTSDPERKALVDSLDPKYRHESYIPSARTLVQMLGRAYVEAYGPPDDEMKPLNNSVDDGTRGTTNHRHALVVHGPVVYVDDPNDVCNAALGSRYSLTRTLLPIFTKGLERSGQREYRFVILDKRDPGACSKIMPATPELLAAYGHPGDSKGPMHVPEFHPKN